MKIVAMMKTKLFRGKPLYKGLSTKYVVIDKLIEDLVNKKFTGYMEISFKNGAYGEILFLNGNSISSNYYAEKVFKGEEAKRILFDSVKTNEGEIGIYELREDQVEILQTLMEGVPFNIELSTNFVMLDKLIEELQNLKHTGYLNVKFENGAIGMLIFREGEIIGGRFEEGDLTITGEKTKNAILSTDGKAIIHIYSVEKDKLASFPKKIVKETKPIEIPKVIHKPKKPEIFDIYQYLILEVMRLASSQPSLGPNMAFSIVKKTIADIKKEDLISIMSESDINFKNFEGPEHVKEIMSIFFKQLKINLAVIVGVKKATSIIYEALENTKKKFGEEIEEEIRLRI